jgi:hypothetical protein
LDYPYEVEWKYQGDQTVTRWVRETELLEVEEVVAKPDNQVETGVVLRSSLDYFATLMEQKLRKNDHKRNWKELSVKELKAGFESELNELGDAFDDYNSEDIVEECVDVANYCMMIADKIIFKSRIKK